MAPRPCGLVGSVLTTILVAASLFPRMLPEKNSNTMAPSGAIYLKPIGPELPIKSNITMMLATQFSTLPAPPPVSPTFAPLTLNEWVVLVFSAYLMAMISFFGSRFLARGISPLSAWLEQHANPSVISVVLQILHFAAEMHLPDHGMELALLFGVLNLLVAAIPPLAAALRPAIPAATPLFLVVTPTIARPPMRDSGVQASPPYKDAAVQASVPVKDAAVQASVSVRDAGVQTTPSVRDAGVQTCPSTRDVGVQTNLKGPVDQRGDNEDRRTSTSDIPRAKPEQTSLPPPANEAAADPETKATLPETSGDATIDETDEGRPSRSVIERDFQVARDKAWALANEEEVMATSFEGLSKKKRLRLKKQQDYVREARAARGE